MTRFRWGVATDVGRTRSVNQDSAYAADGFFAVADGMGGHQGGEIASAIAIDTLTAALPAVGTDDVLVAIDNANRAVLARAADDPSLRGMGTTLCVLALVAGDDADEPLLVVANVGDSRAYQFVGGVLEQMTEDHSMVGEMVRQGRISAAEAEAHPQRNILTRALGIDHRTQIDAWHVRPLPGDRWLLCSDGLFNEVTERAIADVLGAIDDPTVAARHLVQLANDNGGRDNITVVVADVLADGDHAVPAPLTALQEGELASARRRVSHEAPGEPPPAAAGHGGLGRSDLTGLATAERSDESGDATRSAAATPEPMTPAARSGDARGVHDERPGVGGRLRAAWRVVVFVVAVIAVIVVAAGAWLTLRDDTEPVTPPLPGPPSTATTSSTTSTSTTSTTAISPTATTTIVTTTAVDPGTTVAPAAPGSTPG